MGSERKEIFLKRLLGKSGSTQLILGLQISKRSIVCDVFRCEAQLDPGPRGMRKELTG